jgi:hypothetical protein
MIKQRSKKSNSKKRIIALLVMLSLVLSTGTFAYWASYVEGTSTEAVGTLTVGSGDTVETVFSLTNEINSGGLLVPVGQAVNSNGEAVEYINLAFDIQWLENEETTQLNGTVSSAPINVEYKLVITHNGDILDQEEYSMIYDLINVVSSEFNPAELILDAASKTFTYQVTLNEPSNKEEYNLISNADIAVTFSYSIDTNNINTIDIIEIIEEEPYSKVVLNGDSVVYVEVSEQYVDPGSIAYDSKGNEITNTWTTGSVNFWEIGTYTRTYEAYSSFDNEFVESATRTIVVVDTTAPELTMNGAKTTTIKQGWTYGDSGAWANDNSGETITVEVTGLEDVNTSVIGEYTITYTATDSSGNQSTISRTVIVK